MKNNSFYKINCLVLAVAFVFGICACNAQSVYKEVPKSIIPAFTSTDSISRVIAQKKPNAFDLTKVLPANYVKDGSVDYTTYIQKGLADNRVVLFPAFPVLINSSGLTVSSNSDLIFQKGSKLLMQPTSSDTYEMLRVHQVQNINIYNPVLVGERDQHQGTTGEFGIGIDVRTASNVNILNANISKCWGDGIFVGSVKAKIPNGKMRYLEASNNVTIINSTLDYNRRNGISLVNVKGVNIKNAIISNTKGTFPKAGIDIEPGYTDDIAIANVTTFNNLQGIVIMLRSLAAKKDNKFNVSIDNHKDFSSAQGLRIVGYDAKGMKTGSPIAGGLTIKNSDWNQNSHDALIMENDFSRIMPIRLINIKGTNKQGATISGQRLRSVQKKLIQGTDSNISIK